MKTLTDFVLSECGVKYRFETGSLKVYNHRFLKDDEVELQTDCGYAGKYSNYTTYTVLKLKDYKRAIKKADKNAAKLAKKYILSFRSFDDLRRLKLSSYDDHFDSVFSKYHSYINDLKKLKKMLNKKSIKTIEFILFDKIFVKKAPKGWSFGKDEYGFKIYKDKDDDVNYHFDLKDFILESPTKLKNIAIKNYKARKLQKRIEEELKNIKLKDTYVFLEDSLSAGNCKIGTLNFIKKHKIKNIEKGIRADILKKLDPDNYRVDIAISNAKERIAKEKIEKRIKL